MLTSATSQLMSGVVLTGIKSLPTQAGNHYQHSKSATIRQRAILTFSGQCHYAWSNNESGSKRRNLHQLLRITCKLYRTCLAVFIIQMEVPFLLPNWICKIQYQADLGSCFEVLAVLSIVPFCRNRLLLCINITKQSRVIQKTQTSDNKMLLRQ